MRQSYRIIPIYTADVSGVCSALYELGGMTVMHDPSGCNSTYNTHDEIRWYEQDSMIYISGLTEIDAVMGNDEKMICDIELAAEGLKPKFIALAGSPIPYMNGTDFPAIARMLEQDLGIPAFSIPTNGMHDYVYGAGLALAEIAKRIKGKKEVTSKSVNLLGVTPLDFGPQEHVDALKRNVEETGWKVLSTWAMGDTLEDLGRAPEAEVNLVVSSVGLWAAKVLQGEVRDTLCDRDTDPGIYEESFECNRRKKAGSISRKGKAHQPDRKQIGKKFRKPDYINRRTGDHGIFGSSDRDGISDICKSNLSDKGEERITCGWRYCSPWRRRTGTGTSEIKECKRHCSGSIVSPGLSGECGIL